MKTPSRPAGFHPKDNGGRDNLYSPHEGAKEYCRSHTRRCSCRHSNSTEFRTIKRREFDPADASGTGSRGAARLTGRSRNSAGPPNSACAGGSAGTSAARAVTADGRDSRGAAHRQAHSIATAHTKVRSCVHDDPTSGPGTTSATASSCSGYAHGPGHPGGPCKSDNPADAGHSRDARNSSNTRAASQSGNAGATGHHDPGATRDPGDPGATCHSNELGHAGHASNTSDTSQSTCQAGEPRNTSNTGCASRNQCGTGLGHTDVTVSCVDKFRAPALTSLVVGIDNCEPAQAAQVSAPGISRAHGVE